jgi:phosphoserine phosphatase
MPIKIVFLDCDGTLTRVKSSWEYLHRRLRLWGGNAERYQELFLRGEIDYHEFCARDALLWKGLPVSEVARIAGEIPHQRGARELVAGLRRHKVLTVIVSTGLSLVAQKAKHDLGIHMVFSNELLAEEGFLSGEVRINVEHGGKGRIIRQILAARDLQKEEACAIGDGEGDIGMFQEVGLPIGFHPGERMRPFIRGSVNNGSLVGALNIIKHHDLCHEA